MPQCGGDFTEADQMRKCFRRSVSDGYVQVLGFRALTLTVSSPGEGLVSGRPTLRVWTYTQKNTEEDLTHVWSDLLAQCHELECIVLGESANRRFSDPALGSGEVGGSRDESNTFFFDKQRSAICFSLVCT